MYYTSRYNHCRQADPISASDLVNGFHEAIVEVITSYIIAFTKGGAHLPIEHAFCLPKPEIIFVMMVNDSKHTNSEGENIDENIVEYKVYKVKPYLNSDKDPFGLTINGKSKEYVHAHQTIKGLLKKAKQF